MFICSWWPDYPEEGSCYELIASLSKSEFN